MADEEDTRRVLIDVMLYITKDKINPVHRLSAEMCMRRLVEQMLDRHSYQFERFILSTPWCEQGPAELSAVADALFQNGPGWGVIVAFFSYLCRLLEEVKRQGDDAADGGCCGAKCAIINHGVEYLTDNVEIMEFIRKNGGWVSLYYIYSEHRVYSCILRCFASICFREVLRRNIHRKTIKTHLCGIHCSDF
jgi:hypothetical protein